MYLLLSIIIEAVVLFVLIAGLLLFDFVQRDLLSEEIIAKVLQRTVELTIFFVIFTRIFKSGFLYVLQLLFSSYSRPSHSQKTISLTEIASTVFLSLAFILATTTMRPVLQNVYVSGDNVSFDHGLVAFDPLFSMGILTLIGLPLSYIYWKKYKGFERNLAIIGVIGVIAVVGLATNKPNYAARVYEARADWITQDWQQQGETAQKALKDAQTDQEKAVAYYWMGVAANRQGDRQTAITHQLQAIALDPTYGAPHSSLSLAFSLTGEIERAGEHAQKCIDLAPSYAWCYYAESVFLYDMEQPWESYLAMKKANLLDPNSKDIKARLDWFEEYNPQFVTRFNTEIGTHLSPED